MIIDHENVNYWNRRMFIRLHNTKGNTEKCSFFHRELLQIFFVRVKKSQILLVFKDFILVKYLNYN